MAVHNTAFYYVDPAKTGSQTMKTVLTTHYGAKDVKPPLLGWKPKPGQAVIVSVRDPYSRVVSLWWATCAQKGHHRWAEYCDGIVSMVTWLKERRWLTSADAALLEQTPWCSNLYYTMSEWLCGIKPDFLLHQETLEEDFRKLPFYQNKPDVLPKVNGDGPPGRGPVEEYLTPAVVAAVNDWCHDDFVQFGYKKRDA